MSKLLIIGDSFVEGVGDTEDGWAYRLKRQLDDKHEINVSGVGGRNVLDVEKELSARLTKDDIDILIVNIGINDSRTRASKGNKLEVEPADFLNACKRVIQMAHTSKAHTVIFLGTSRVDESIVKDYKPDKSHTNEGAQEIDYILASLANDKDILYIPISHLINPRVLPKTLSDGLHPNSNGHMLITKTVYNDIVARGIIGETR